MKREEHKTILNKILGYATPENQASVSELLTQLTDDYDATLTENENLTTKNTELSENNETLRSVNAKLFLKVGETDKETHKEKHTKTDIKKEEIPSFDGLFNEKGELV